MQYVCSIGRGIHSPSLVSCHRGQALRSHHDGKLCEAKVWAAQVVLKTGVLHVKVKKHYKENF